MKALVAGSLRAVWQPLMAAFYELSGERVDTGFGPAGLLRMRIEQGESCDLFASANLDHPLSLFMAGRAHQVMPFATNRLCLTVKTDCLIPGDTWLSVLSRPELRLGTSTPVSDPSGDYTWQLFRQIEWRYPGQGMAIQQRAQCLVGGSETLSVPPGETAAGWLINQGRVDMFIGYASYAARLRRITGLTVLDIPEDMGVQAQYTLALLDMQAECLAVFLGSPLAQKILIAAGFGPGGDEIFANLPAAVGCR
ncbi:substrate-binding domain-containing protein [Mangrovibacter phragmitis]|uniref:substrate-binding domain-containing protein n=1 Tax=Mangrovibacter phragmitis TaxID=1691903 RepID=UPI0035187885